MQLPLQPLFKKYLIAIFILAGLGFVDAAFLSVEHYLGKIPPCTVLAGCEKVTTSAYSVVFGIPVAYAGVMYYIGILVLLILFIDFRKKIFFDGLYLLVGFGFIGSVWFTYAQLFIIKALCPYCLFSGLVSTVLFFTLLHGARRYKTWNTLL